eukprot:1182505-Prorocentrum_minimum.AAC.3
MGARAIGITHRKPVSNSDPTVHDFRLDILCPSSGDRLASQIHHGTASADGTFPVPVLDDLHTCTGAALPH